MESTHTAMDNNNNTQNGGMFSPTDTTNNAAYSLPYPSEMTTNVI